MANTRLVDPIVLINGKNIEYISGTFMQNDGKPMLVRERTLQGGKINTYTRTSTDEAGGKISFDVLHIKEARVDYKELQDLSIAQTTFSIAITYPSGESFNMLNARIEGGVDWQDVGNITVEIVGDEIQN